MREFFIAIFCFFVLMFISSQAAIIEVPEATAGMIIQKVETTAGDAFEISDDFDSGVFGDDWTSVVGTWAFDTGDMELNSESTDSACYYDTTALANSYRQFCKVEITAFNSGDYVGLFFRQGSTGTYAYNVGFSGAAATWDEWAAGSWLRNVEVGLSISPNVGATVWLGAEVENTGDNTEVRVWTWAADPGERGSWGAADDSSVANPTNAANDGTYVGLFGYVNSAGKDYNAWDNWTCGSSSGSPL
jgi:hypothetical protein